MSNQLPDLDENVSFVVDDGAPVGPMAMRTIIDSIRSGERGPDVLVWWAGATDWLSFSSDSGLTDLLSELPATNQPPPPPDVEEVLSAVSDGQESHDEDNAGIAAEPEVSADVAEERFPEPEVTSFEVESVDPVAQSEPSEGALATVAVAYLNDDDDADSGEPEDVEAAWQDMGDDQSVPEEDDEVSAGDEEPSFDPAAEAEADAILAGGPRAMHPSAGWGVDDESDTIADPPPSEASLGADVAFDVDEVVEPEPEPESEVVPEAETEPEAEPESEPAMEVVEPEQEPEPEGEAELEAVPEAETEPVMEDPPEQGLTGLFGSSMREARRLEDEPPADDDATPRATLETVGARIDALTSATRRAQQLEQGVEVGPEPEVEPEPEQQREPETATQPELQSAAGSWQAVEGGPDLEERFAGMVQRSIEHQRRMDWELRVDELLLSACITAIVDKGFVLLDLEAHDTSQRAVFDHHDDSRHIRLELEPLSPVNAAGDPVGRHVKASIGWGRDVADADAAFVTVRTAATDEEPMPGTILSEVNMVSSSAMTVVDLIWAANDYVHDDHSIDRLELDSSIAAILHALEARWYELFVARD